MSWSAPLSAQDVLGIKIGDSPEQVQKTIESSNEGWKGGLQKNSEPTLRALLVDKDWVPRFGARLDRPDGSSRTLDVEFALPPARGVARVKLRETYRQRILFSVVQAALKNKYGSPFEQDTPGGRRLYWGFDSAGKPVSGRTDFVGGNCDNIWSLSLHGGTGNRASFDAQVSDHVRKSCPRQISASTRFVSADNLIELYSVELVDSNYWRDAFVKARDAVDRNESSQRQNELDKAKGVAAPKF